MIILLLPLMALVFGAIILGVAWKVKKSRDAGTEKPAKTAKKSDTADKSDAEDNRRLGYRYAEGSIFVHGKSVWTGARLAAITDEQLSYDELLDQVRAATVGIKELSISDDPVPIMLRLTHRPITTGAWTENLIAQAWNPTTMYKRLMARVGVFLELINTTRPEVYLLVKIGTVNAAGEAAIARRLDGVVSGVATESLTRDEIESWHSKADDLLSRLRGLDITPLTREDLVWLIRKPMHGHLVPSPVETLRTRAWGTGEFELVAEVSGTNHKTHLVLHQIADDPTDPTAELGERKTTYTTFLAASEWPAKTTFSLNRAWIRHIANNMRGVEVVLRAFLIPPKEFVDQAKKMRNDINEEVGDIEKSGRPVDRNMSAMAEDAESLVQDLEADPFPGMESQIMLQLSASSPSELERLVREVTQAMKTDLGITMRRPRKFAYRALENFLPGDRPANVPAPYVHLQEAEVIGCGLPNTGSQVGDNTSTTKDGMTLGWIGHLIGATGDGVPVHYSTHVGPTRNGGGGVATVGASGGGKSTLALLEFFYESESGVRVMAVDPKVDFAKFCLYLSFGPQVNEPGFDDEFNEGILGKTGSKFTPVNQQFWDDTEIIDITNSVDGALEVFQIAKTVSEGYLLALTVFGMFLGDDEYKRHKMFIQQAVSESRLAYQKRVAAGADKGVAEKDVERPTMWEIVDRVRDQADAAVAAKADFQHLTAVKGAAASLEQLRDMPYARLTFAKNPKSLGSLRSRRTVFTTRGMDLPRETNPDNWGDTHRLSTTILFLVTRLAAQLLEVSQEPNPITGRMALQPKLLFVDESYAVSTLPAGRQMIQNTLAQGRSYNTVIWLIDQQAGRFAQLEEDGSDEATGNQFHTVFAYLQKTKTEARKVLPLLGREGNPTTADALLHENKPGGHMNVGIAMMRDQDFRVATIHIDTMFKELLAATDTNPKTRPERQSAPISADPYQWTISNEDDTEAAIEETIAQLHLDQPDSGDLVDDDPTTGTVGVTGEAVESTTVGDSDTAEPVLVGQGEGASV